MTSKNFEIAMEKIEQMEREINLLKEANLKLKNQSVNQNIPQSKNSNFKVDLKKILLERDQVLAKISQRNLNEG